MREKSLQWALGLGAAAAALGVGAQMIGASFQPRGQGASFDQAIRYILVAGPLVLLSVGIALGLAYFAGLRAERDRPPSEPLPDDAIPPWGGERRDSALAGAIVMGVYWLLTSLDSTLLLQRGSGLGDILTQHAIQGVLFVLFGYGMGALGGRAPAARKLLDSLVVDPEDAPGGDGGPPVEVPRDGDASGPWESGGGSA